MKSLKGQIKDKRGNNNDNICEVLLLKLFNLQVMGESMKKKFDLLHKKFQRLKDLWDELDLM